MESTLTTTAVMLSEKQAAEIILARPQTLRAWRHRGRGPNYLKLAGKIRYLRDDLEKFIQEGRIVIDKSKRKRPRRKGSK
jgi:Helix-turn-helix domain